MARRNRRTSSMLTGLAAGAIAQYFLDPVQGRTRRVKTKDQALAALRRPMRKAQQRASAYSEYARNRGRGLAHELTHRDKAPEDDRTLVDKVRSEVLGREEWRGLQINVDSVAGVVSLRGQVEHEDQTDALEMAVLKVPGVRAVESFLHLPGVSPPNKASSLRL